MSETRWPGSDLHHIGEYGDPRSVIIRYILEEAGIDVRVAEENGIYLPRTSMDPRLVPQAATRHQTVHTNAYIKEQIRRLVDARRHDGVTRELATFKRELREGQFFHIESGPNRRESVADWLVRHRDDFDFLSDETFEEIVEATRRPPREPLLPGEPRPYGRRRRPSRATTAPKAAPLASPATPAAPAAPPAPANPARPHVATEPPKRRRRRGKDPER